MILEGVFKMKGIVQTVSGLACVEASFLSLYSIGKYFLELKMYF